MPPAKCPLGAMSKGRGRPPVPTECKRSRRKVLVNNSLLFFRRASLPCLAIIKVPGCRNNLNRGLSEGKRGREDVGCHDAKLFITEGMH